MLDFLHLENIAVAKDLEINFSNGFNILTGETGAGKSIIIDSINMLLGAKMSKDIIRNGEVNATVTAYFSDISESIYSICDELGISYDREDVFSITRTINSEGKNTVRINSHPSTLAQLKAIGCLFVNIHGQNENHSFINKSNHILLLDEYSSNEVLLQEYKSLYERLNALKNEISTLVKDNEQKDTMIEILKFQIKEISSAKLKDLNEEEKLVALRGKLKGAEKIIKNSNNVYRALFQNESGISAYILIDKAIESLNRLSELEPAANELSQRLNELKFEIEDIAERARDFVSFDGIDDPERQLDALEGRLALIQRLEKKYGSSIEEIIKFKDEAELKLKTLENVDNRIADLKHEYKTIYSKASDIASKIHGLRVKAASKLSKIVKDALEYLDMPKVKFEIKVEEAKKDGKIVLSSNGCDDVEFMIATNAGEDLAPMSKIASGGELARIMLALKSALSDKKGAQTVIFDEIDTGVSGSTSQKIGIKLATISKNTQTFCVTHSAQIASLADQHYLIKKQEINGRAETKVSLLSDEERVHEIARIIGGIDLSEKQYDAARELLSQSRDILKNI